MASAATSNFAACKACILNSAESRHSGAAFSSKNRKSRNTVCLQGQSASDHSLWSTHSKNLGQLRGRTGAIFKQVLRRAPNHGNYARKGTKGVVICGTGMNLVFVSSEVAPWSKTGGLGDVLGGLPPALAARGHRVMSVSPRYDQYKDSWDTDVLIDLKVGDKIESVRFFHSYKRGVDRVFIDHPLFLAKVWGKTAGKIYGPITGVDYQDNQLRFSLLCQVSEPLVRVMHLVDGEKNPMGFLYEAMDVAKEAIANYYGKNKKKYEPIWRIIDRRWNKQLHRHIHAAAYYLNPKFFYSESFKADEEVMDGLMTCIERMVPDEETREIIVDRELQIYKTAEGRLFSSSLCIRRRNTAQPDLWWEDYGAKTPNLQKLAIRILCQPCSSSGCERNWSMFEAIHTKKRNRLATQRLNDLVFVRYNLRLRVRQVEGAESHEAIDLDDIDPYGDWIAERDLDDEPMFTEEEFAALEREAEDYEAIASGTGAAEADAEDVADDVGEEEFLPSTSRGKTSRWR